MATVLEREEYIEQAYFFRMMREQMAQQISAQEVLAHVHGEILSTTRLPLAIQFLATEVKHSGLLSSGFARLSHYFTPFQTYVVRQTEVEKLRFGIEIALLILEREATYRAGTATPQGLFVYQFEALCRNRLGYEDGLRALEGEPLYDERWRAFVNWVRVQVGIVDFADLIYLRSELYLHDQRRMQPEYEPPLPVLFGEKEGNIAKANRGRDPLYLFAALQRQLSYPEVPRPRPAEDASAKVLSLEAKVRELETRTRILEGEMRGQLDVSQFAKPDILADLPDDD